MNTVRQRLRAETRDSHEDLDRSLSAYDLAHPGTYGGFLRLHALALPGVEAAAAGLWSGFEPRILALLEDLADLGLPPPEPLRFDGPPTPAGRWGCLYVVEGSRLGGAVLLGRVPIAMPRRYLAPAPARTWRAFQDALGAAHAAAAAAGPAGGSQFLEDAALGAKGAFAHFAAAAAAEARMEARTDAQAADPGASGA